MRSASSNKKYWLVVLAVITCFHLINNYLWLANSTDIDGVDVSNHLYFQLKFHNLFKECVSGPAIALFSKFGLLLSLMRTPMAHPGNVYWPNFLNFSSTIFTVIFGSSLLVVKLTMQIYLLILLFSTYSIGRRLGGRSTGVAAVFFVSMYPLIFESSRQYGLDLPLTALVCLANLLLLKTEYFTRMKYSALLGVAVGIAMLIKGQFLIFFGVPFLLITGAYFPGFGGRRFNARIFLNIYLFILIALSIAFIWWFGRLGAVFDNLILHSSSGAKFLESGTVNKMGGWEYYLYNARTLVLDSLGIVFTVVFVLSLAGLLRKKEKHGFFLLSWIFVPLFLFSFLFVIKHERFLMPVLPAIALISGWGVTRLRTRGVKTITVIFLAVFALSQYFTLSYFNYWYNQRYKLRKSFPIFGSSSYGRTPYISTPYYDNEKLLFAKEAAEFISRDCSSQNDCSVGEITIAGPVCSFEMVYWLYYFAPKLRVLDWVEHYRDFYLELPKLKYLILISYKRDGFTWPEDQRIIDLAIKYRILNIQLVKNYDGWEKNIRSLFKARDDFELVKTLEFSNGITWYIHKRKENK